jgi:ATP synthase F1 complex assembly factor 1
MRGSSALRAAWRRLSAGDYARQWTVRAGDGALGFAAPNASRWVPTQTKTMSTLIPPPKSLGEVTHVDLLNKEDSEAIEGIWREYHEGKSGRIGARVHPDTYGAFRDRSTSCPMFVIPLHKSPSKFLTLVVQAKMPYASFTAIDDFRKLQEAAPPMMVAAHYPELVESKDMVLVQAAHVDADTAGAAEHLTAQEALRLIRLCHKFYADDALYEKFVKPFNHAQKNFDFDAFTAEVAKVTWSDDVIR